MTCGDDQGGSVSLRSLVNGLKEDHEDNQKRDNIEPQETKVISDPAIKFLEPNGLQKLQAYHSIIPPPPPVKADTDENEDIAPSPFCSCFKQLSIGQEWLI